MSGKTRLRAFPRLAIALAAATALLLIALFGLLYAQKAQNDKASAQAAEMVLISEKPADIQRVTLDSQKGIYSIVLDSIIQGDILVWKIENADNTDVDQTSLKFIIQRCSDLKVSRNLGVAAKQDYPLYGLDTPLVRVTVKYKSGTRSFLVGDQYANQGFYLLEEGTGKLYVAQNTVGEYWGWSENEVRNLPGLFVNMGNVGALLLERRGQPELRLVYAANLTEEGYSWQFTQPIMVKANAAKMGEYLEGLKSFRMTKYMAAHMESPADYGFTEPYARMILLGATDDFDSQILLIGNPVPDMADYRYAVTYNPKTEELENCRLYALSTEGMSSFTINALDYIDRGFALLNIKDVTGIKLTIEGKENTIEIRRSFKLDDDGEPMLDVSGEKIIIDRFFLNGETELNELQFRSFYAQLIGLKMESLLTDKDPPYDESQLVFAFSFTTSISLDGEGGHLLVMDSSCYQMDENFLALSNNGKIATKVKKDKVEQLVYYWHLLLEGKMPLIRDKDT